MSIYRNSDSLVKYIGDKSVFQKKYLEKTLAEELNETEKQELENIIEFFLKEYTLREMVDAYLLFVDDILEETKYFVENEKYKYSSFAEVNEKVYTNDMYMKKYMLGLQLSGYIWKNHLLIHRWFKDKIRQFSGKDYLEIGPGHGQYFLEAINEQNFEQYTGIDISLSAVKLAIDYINCFKKTEIRNYSIICDDFLKLNFEKKFDMVCMSEVLEHLEEPARYLEKIYDITNAEANIYISVPINAPAMDHIYLFHSIEEVFSMVQEVGFTIKDYFYVTGNDISYEKAVKRKRAINLALHMMR